MPLTYTDAEIDLRSVPGEICYTYYICNCPCHCPGCSSPWLWQDGKFELTENVIAQTIAQRPYISCILFMGGDSDIERVRQLADFVRSKRKKAAFYSGRQIKGDLAPHLDYYKVGHWDAQLGPLNSPTTNQHLYSIVQDDDTCRFYDITSKFWTRENIWRPQQEKTIEQDRAEWEAADENSKSEL